MTLKTQHWKDLQGKLVDLRDTIGYPIPQNRSIVFVSLQIWMQYVVIIEDTLSMFKEFISSQTVRKNYYPHDDNLESDWL